MHFKQSRNTLGHFKSRSLPGAPNGEVAELSDVTLLGLGVRLREDGLGCGEERCCFRRKRGESEGDLLFGDLKGNHLLAKMIKYEICTQHRFSNLIVMGLSSSAAAKAALSKSVALPAAAAMISCFVALPSFAGDASLELAAEDVMEFILDSIAEANLKRGEQGKVKTRESGR